MTLPMELGVILTCTFIPSASNFIVYGDYDPRLISDTFLVFPITENLEIRRAQPSETLTPPPDFNDFVRMREP